MRWVDRIPDNESLAVPNAGHPEANVLGDRKPDDETLTVPDAGHPETNVLGDDDNDYDANIGGFVLD